MLLELAAQRALTDAGLFRQRSERAFRQLAAIDPGQQARQRRRQIAGGGGRELRPAAQAGAQAVLLRCGGALEVAHVVLVRWSRRTDRPAVDAGGEHAGKEAAVEARIAGQTGGMALLGAERQVWLILCGRRHRHGVICWHRWLLAPKTGWARRPG